MQNTIKIELVLEAVAAHATEDGKHDYWAFCPICRDPHGAAAMLAKNVSPGGPRDAAGGTPPGPPARRAGPPPDIETHIEKRFKRQQTAIAALRARVASLDERTVQIEFERAGGDCLCSCGLAYFDHPRHPTNEWLTLLCDGRAVKL